MTKLREDIVENIDTEIEEYQELPKNIKEKLEWFQDQKLGVIFHWGLYSLAGIVESWQLSEEDDWARKKPWRNDVTELREDYWGLNHSFNPYRFNPDEWAKECKNAGFRYMIFTTKHHDGFNMYDTKFSDYKITAEPSPFRQNIKSDLFGEVAKSFRDVGLNVGAYYSKPDWHSPLYWVPGEHAKGRQASYNPKEKPETWAKYNEFVTNQLTEISENYGDIDILWLDGGWVNARDEQLDMDQIAQNVRSNQPDMLIVDRMIGGKYEDYVTPERKIPEVPPTKVWESNIPLAKNWGFCPNDIYKPFEEILDSLVQVVCLGGNLILGVGPKPDGRLPNEALAILRPLGEWLDTFGEGIYETRAIPELTIPGWTFTQKDNHIYAFQKRNEQNSLELKQIREELPVVTCLNTNERLTGEIITPIHDESYYQIYRLSY